MVRKGLCIWLFSSLTFISTLHLLESIYVLFFNGQIRLLGIYPLINQKLDIISPVMYFWASLAASLIFWGITCAIAFDNPVEHFLNIMLSEAKKQGITEAQTVEQKCEVLDAMYETVESSNETLANVKDMLHNVRTDVRQIQPLTESIERIKTELNSLRRDFKRLDEIVKSPNLCPSCGKAMLPEFKLCPFCGDNLKMAPEKMISLKAYR